MTTPQGVLGFFGALLTLAGSMFLFLGALGVFRMPDIYNRMQAGTKSTTLGNILTLGGLGLLMPGWLPKIVLVILFVLITNPISSHALARSAHRSGMRLAAGSVVDALAADEAAQGIEPGSNRELDPAHTEEHSQEASA
jgi:multicomponent Na+:H+ antiporter subunit G